MILLDLDNKRALGICKKNDFKRDFLLGIKALLNQMGEEK